MINEATVEALLRAGVIVSVFYLLVVTGVLFLVHRVFRGIVRNPRNDE